MPVHSLTEILYPDSIAVIGASKEETKRGFRSIQKLIEDGYPGEIYPINPKEPEILGLRCYPDIADVPGSVDLVLVCTPAKTLPEIIARCGTKGVKGAVVLAGGFAEAGEQGSELQQQMVDVARANGIRIIGPNTSGIFNTHRACNIVGFANLRKGGIGLLSQSGNMALSLVTEAEANGPCRPQHLCRDWQRVRRSVRRVPRLFRGRREYQGGRRLHRGAEARAQIP